MATSAKQGFAEIEDEVVEYETIINEDFVNARVKGTWTLHFDGVDYDFEDGKQYRLPRNLFGYLKSYGNIYVTY